MSRTLNDIMAGLPEERRQHIEARAATLLEQEILRQLRKALGLSQKDLHYTARCLQARTSNGYATQYACWHCASHGWHVGNNRTVSR